MNINKEILELSVILPCLNEEEGIGRCLDEVKKIIRQLGLTAEVIVVDNGSTDASAKIVLAAMKDFSELKLVQEKKAGYGRACLAGFKQARGKHIFMADSDGTYDFSEIPLFIKKLDQGFDLVVGNRFARPMRRGVMPIHHKYIGNPVLSVFVRRFFGVKIRDVYCGARALTGYAFREMDLRSGGMEFALEMIVQAARRGLKLAEVPMNYRERLGTSKLRSMRDGWRSLRFILLYSPLYLFFIPGVALVGLGVVTMGVMYFTSPTILGIRFYIHPMFLSAPLIILGYELVFFAFFAKIYAVTHLGERSPVVERLFRLITLERAGAAGMIVAILGIFIYWHIFDVWASSDFGSLDQIKNSVVALTLVTVGTQTVFSAFMLSIVGIQEKNS